MVAIAILLCIVTTPFIYLALLPQLVVTALGDFAASVEPSAVSLAIPMEDKSYGYGYGGSLDAGITQQLTVTAFARRDRFSRRDPGVGATSAGAALRYCLDVGEIEPYLELGVARVELKVDRRAALPAETHPVLGLGLQGVVSKRLLWGVVMRYYPLFDTDLLGAPAYASLQGRLGVAFGSND